MDHADPSRDRIGRSRPDHSSSVHQESAGIRTDHSERDPHQRGLSGTVLTEESVNGSGSNGETSSVQCRDSAEVLYDINERDRRGFHHRVSHAMLALPCCCSLEACGRLDKHPR
jgi:hypothetical protein